jgi:hypothetical protein
MTVKLYTHFVADMGPGGQSEYTGIVELGVPEPMPRDSKWLARELARDLDLSSEDIRVLHWARVH